MSEKAPHKETLIKDIRKLGRPSRPYSQTLRLLRIIELLHLRRRGGITIAEIVEKFGVTDRTGRRELLPIRR